MKVSNYHHENLAQVYNKFSLWYSFILLLHQNHLKCFETFMKQTAPVFVQRNKEELAGRRWFASL